MPELSRFFGIIIRMFYSDHEPAHFHAIYGEYEALIEIDTLAVFRDHYRAAHSHLYSNGHHCIAMNCVMTGDVPAREKC
jgi:Domain of unknown function (DUF4160)